MGGLLAFLHKDRDYIDVEFFEGVRQLAIEGAEWGI